jgi:hypothetical protein
MTIMYLGDPARHFWMTRSVARVMGVSLSTAMAEGRLSSDEYAKMVTRCRACQQVADCELWLATVRNGPAEIAPVGCANAADYAQAKGDDGPPRKRGGSGS